MRIGASAANSYNASSYTSLWKWDSLPFGETEPNANPSNLGTMAFNHRFPGQYYDKETGLNQNWHRDYDPRLDRYIEVDPIGLKDGPNPFVYVASNPINRTDTAGLSWCDVQAAVLAAQSGWAGKTDGTVPPLSSFRLGLVPGNGQYNFNSGVITLNNSIFGGDGLSPATLDLLLRTVIHESGHGNNWPISDGHYDGPDDAYNARASCIAKSVKGVFQVNRSILNCK